VAIVLLLTAFALAPVLLSHDVYSYVDYARLGAVHGLDPYTHAPLAAPADPAFSHVEWTRATTVYGPLFTLATYPLALLPVGLAVAVLKASSALAVLGSAVVVSRLAAARGVDPGSAAAFVALNPLVLIHVVGGAHNDGLAILFATLGVAGVLARRELGGGASLAAAFAVKATACFAAPFAIIGSRDRRRFLLGAAGALALVTLASWTAFGFHWLDAVADESGSRTTSHWSVPSTVARLAGANTGLVRVVALIAFGALLGMLLAWAWRGADWVRAAAWAGLGLLLATAWLLPWYVIWALPLAAISRDRTLQLLVLALTAFQLRARMPL
jgi:alpha-1,6-mannosyltransferase